MGGNAEGEVSSEGVSCIPDHRKVLFYSVIFFCYGFFIDFKPSEPFLVPYLINVKGFTNPQVCPLLL